MNVTNINSSVPDAVRDLFFGYLPYGSDYVMYCSRSDAAGVSYTCLYRRVGSSSVDSVTVSRNGGAGDFVVTSSSTNNDYDGFTVSNPYYAYSNLEGQGRYTVNPSGQNLVVLMLIVCASIAVLRLVFGGISLWAGKSDPY